MKNTPDLTSEISAVRAACDNARTSGRRIALVPTMGALHQGHLSLVDQATLDGDFTVVTVFVNPTQFGPNEDYSRYPRILENDMEKLQGRNVSMVFAPTVESMYLPQAATTVGVANLTDGLCGASRPGHFDGVTTVVAKLFNIVGPCRAIFGRKDYQQLQVIKRMVRDLNMPIEVVGMPTFREADGLAMSSRNAYLNKDQRGRALALVRGLKAAHHLYQTGEREVGVLRKAVLESVASSADSIDYVTATDPNTLKNLDDNTFVQDKLLIAIAAHIGKTRLIDNTVLGEDALN
jgi:pantoate--beta-alanine ligase